MSDPFVMVIFGATGDLARNKLVPALFSLYKKKQLPEKFSIIGFARRSFTDQEFRDLLPDSSHSNDTHHHSVWNEFSKNLFYQQGDFSEQEGYDALAKKLDELDKKSGKELQRYYYLATPPDNYETILYFLASTKLSEDTKHQEHIRTKVIIEKPFGKDLETARMLDKKLAEIFKEAQIFRVDHYLGKETVQNMIAFRFANGIFEPVWNNKFIDHVQITFAEKKGIGTRGKFFDGIGMLRDVGQNHLLQLLATVAMEQPVSFSKESVRDARAFAIKAINGPTGREVNEYVVRGQYKGYSNEPHVAKDSDTETFVAMKLFVDTPRFSGVPFYLRAGKHMEKDDVSIKIVFIQTCHILFKEYGCPEIGNVLTISIQPNEGIGLRVIAKQPGAKVALGTVDMKFSYKEEFGGKGAEAYEKLLMDIFSGDQMLFNRSDELESSWGFITNILEGWKNTKNLHVYEPGGWGPKEAESLIEKDHKKWL